MNKFTALIGGLSLGAGLMFILDPDRGRRRRAVIRDKANRALREAEDALATATRDLGNRTGGILVEAGARLTSTPVSDTTLLARVRSKLGRATSHPRAIDVTVEGGRVILRGPVLASEVASVLGIVSKISGVREVENLLDVHETADIAALQGPANIADERLDILQRNWSPATRLLAGTAGSALAILGARKGGVLGTTLGTVGLGLLTRGVTNTGLTDLIGISSLQGWGEEADAGETSKISGGGKASGRRAGGTESGASSGAQSGTNARISSGANNSGAGSGAGAQANAGATAGTRTSASEGASAGTRTRANAGLNAGTRTGANAGAKADANADTNAGASAGTNSGTSTGAARGATAGTKSAGANASAGQRSATSARDGNSGANRDGNGATNRDGNNGANRDGNAQSPRTATQQGTMSGRSTGTPGPSSRTE